MRNTIRHPLWRGPAVDGVTYSLLSRFLVCRERFRLLVIEGLKTADAFNHRLEFGTMWHLYEEVYADNLTKHGRDALLFADQQVLKYAKLLCGRYPTQQEQVSNWWEICRLMFPVYLDYWEGHKEDHVQPLLQEQVFDVDYTLPSGRGVRLRGKWDGVELVGRGKSAGMYLRENKTKSEIKEGQIKRQLTFDLQTMMYLTALTVHARHVPLRDLAREKGAGAAVPLAGVRYNVIRRPRQYQGKRETPREFYGRLEGIVRDEPSEFFMRWQVQVYENDVERFRTECLDPILESLVDWWEWVRTPGDNYGGKVMTIEGVEAPVFTGNAVHWRHPFGVYNILDEGGSSDLDEYLATGSEVGLERATTLFGELETGGAKVS